jgi:hypothetical protein
MTPRRALHNAARSPRRLAPSQAMPAPRKRCVATTRAGKPCPNWSLRGKQRCNLHSGDTAKVLGARGGRRRAIFNPDGLEPIPTPQEAADLWRLLSQTLIEVRAAKIDTKTAQAVFYGCGVGRSLLELVDFDSRLRALEGRQDELRQARERVN